MAAVAATLTMLSLLVTATGAGAAQLHRSAAHTRATAAVSHASRRVSPRRLALERAHRRAAARARRLAAQRTRVLRGRKATAKQFRDAIKLVRETPMGTAPSSQGTDFWLTFESNCDENGCGSPSGPGDLFLFISGNTATTGTVSDPGIAFTQAFSVTPGVATEVQVPSDGEDDDVSGIDPDAVHVTSGAAVSVYGLNTLEYTTDGFTGLPTSILGTSYIVEGYGGGLGSQFAVVGTQDGTSVTIDPSASEGGYTAGTPFTIDLDQGQVFQLVAGDGGDLSGTTVTSSAPVAVFAGNDCADVPTYDAACNTLAEEMTPTDTWGTGFYTEPLATRSGDTFRVMASQNGTNVDINGTQVATLDAGQWYETILTTASVITANNPIQVMQYSNGQDYDGANADPFDITIPPYAQYENSYTISTEPNGADPAITQNYLDIVAPTSEIAEISLDGTDLPASDFTQIQSSSYSGAQIPVDFGSHTLNAPLPFGLTVYGYGGYDGYGYPGGFTLSPIAVVSSISLTASPGTQTVGDQACATATVEDQNSNPLNGVNVEFDITGANPQIGYAYTGSNGQAQYCWTGTNTGQDTIVASVQTLTSNDAYVNWISAGPASTTLTTSLSGAGQNGATITVPSGTSVTDSSTLTGSNAGSATGSVTYNWYSDAGCTDLVSGPDVESISTPGTMPSSAAVTLNNPGTYYVTASYGGDDANDSSSSTCGAETVTVQSQTQPQPVSVFTVLSGGGQSAPQIFVPNGSSVSDQATLSGANTATAGGTLTYSVYSDPGCTILAAPSETVNVTNGVVPASAGVTLPQGTYWWQDTYNGDPSNLAQTSQCGAETEVVLGTARFGADVGVSDFIYPSSTITGGAPYEYVICFTVTNYGPNTAKNIISALLLPSGVTVDNNGDASTQIGRLLIFKTGTFATGTTETYHVWVSPSGKSSGSGMLDAAAISLGTLDPNYANNFTAESLTFNGPRRMAYRLAHTTVGRALLLARLRALGREFKDRKG